MIITMPELRIPAHVSADCAPAPVPSTILAHAACRHVPTHTVTAAPMLADHVSVGDVIRHPDIPGAFLRVTHDERATGSTRFGYAIHYQTGYLTDRVTPVNLTPGTVVAVWSA